MAGDVRINRQTGNEVPACEVERGADNQVGNFRYGLGADECDPVVCFRLVRLAGVADDTARSTCLLLSGLEDIAVVQEERLHLVDTSWGNEDEIEDSKQSKL